MIGYRKCHLCKRRMRLKYRKNILGISIPENFVILGCINENVLFAHCNCYKKFEKARVMKGRYSAGVKIGPIEMRGEWE